MKKEISFEQWKEELENPKFKLKTWEQAGEIKTKVEFEELGREYKIII